MKGGRKYGKRSVIFAGLGLGLSVPRWLGRSWRDIFARLGMRLESAGLKRPAARRKPAKAALRLKERSALQQGQALNELLEPAVAPKKQEEEHLVEPSPGLPPEIRRSSRTPANLMNVDEIRRRLISTHDEQPPDPAGWPRTDTPEKKIRGYRLVKGPSSNLTVITDAANFGYGPSTDGSALEQEIISPPEPPPTLPPASPPSGQRCTPVDSAGAATAPPPPKGMPDEDILEVDIAEVDIEELDIAEAEELAPVRVSPSVITPKAPRRDPAGAIVTPLFATSARPRPPMAERSQPSEPGPFAPAATDDEGPEELCAPETMAAQSGAGSDSNPFQPRFHPREWLPPLDLLQPAEAQTSSMSQEDLIDCGILIEEKLAEFRVKVNVQDAYAGPVITRYEVQPAVGVRGGQIVNLMRDLARALGVASIRVVETIPGKTCMGLELPNPRRQMIRLSEVLSSPVFQEHKSKLAMVLGKDILGEPVVADLARAPHLLVAGTTGSGKSVGVNAMILSLLYRTTPDEVRLVMIDPKMLELSIYDGIPHLLAPVVTDMKHAANALKWCVGEMERRYRLMSALRVRNLAGYNQKVQESIAAGRLQIDPFSMMPGAWEPLAPLPYIVVVVDEFADLMMVAGKKIEELIARLAQKARAAGIHLILATQRPSVDVITGLIKANIPTRIAFQVSSKIDSRTILDQMGAECLLGQGDMLYLPPGTGYPQRVHGAFVADEEVQAVAEYLKQFGAPDYVEGVLGGGEDADGEAPGSERTDEENDPLYDEAVEFVINSRRASISAIQRQLRVGYNRAARIVEQMEAAGLVSPMESNGNRTILMPAP